MTNLQLLCALIEEIFPSTTCVIHVIPIEVTGSISDSVSVDFAGCHVSFRLDDTLNVIVIPHNECYVSNHSIIVCELDDPLLVEKVRNAVNFVAIGGHMSIEQLHAHNARLK